VAAPKAGDKPWQGFYLGIHAGYGWKDYPFHDRVGNAGGTDFFIDGLDAKGGVFGGTGWIQLAARPLVGGLEIDFSGTGIDGDSAPTVIPIGQGATTTIARSEDVKWLGSARARLGYTPGGG
jgi:outer membrane immunogenic protein